MKDSIEALPRRTVRTVDFWRLREAEAGSRVLDHLLDRPRGVLLAAPPPTMGGMILFREDSADLDAVTRASLMDRSAMLRTNPEIRVVIGGFASHLGSAARAMGLGLQRVQAIRAFLVSQGIEPVRIEVAIRGAEWSLVERHGRSAEEDSSGECRLQIADRQWALSRN